ncbi:MAG: hypothetical protein MJE68_29100 [Proteobacteria bacterium]|nr:hypothetical protein [Pseudomonadota bacterium]
MPIRQTQQNPQQNHRATRPSRRHANHQQNLLRLNRRHATINNIAHPKSPMHYCTIIIKQALRPPLLKAVMSCL